LNLSDYDQEAMEVNHKISWILRGAKSNSIRCADGADGGGRKSEFIHKAREIPAFFAACGNISDPDIWPPGGHSPNGRPDGQA